MDDRNYFFETVLPEEGLLCILGLKGGEQPKQFLLEDTDKATQVIENLDADGFNVYFGTAKYETKDGGRKAENAKWFKSFRVDLDCGDGKPYQDQVEASIALKRFVSDLSLPKPLVVNSGRGLHVYWPLDKTVDYPTWKPIAKALANACRELGLVVDTACTEDAARVLRVPGTRNFKDTPPAPVSIIRNTDRINLDIFTAPLSAYMEVESELGFAVPEYAVMDETTKALLGNTVSRFGTIMKKSLNGKGCQQLANIYRNQESVDYNLWRGGLSIAVNCEDGAEAIHKISHKHNNYSSVETERKAQDTLDKPYRCETFEGIDAKGCEGCAHKGKISSPIQLGVKVVEATEADNQVATIDVKGETIDILIPRFPFPYFRGKNGGVYRKAVPSPDAEGDPVDELICKNDLYVIGRFLDPDEGESIKFRMHKPKDGVIEFLCPLTAVIAKDKFSALLAKYGMPLRDKRLSNVMHYAERWVEEMQNTDKAEVARNQFGWCENDTKFIVGNREISANGVTYSPSSISTAEVANYYGRKGNIQDWSLVANIYAKPGNEVRAFALFAGFGSALLKFTQLDGGIIHLTNNESGVGKTTIQMMINSIWGHPKLALLNNSDTHLSRIQRAAVLGNVCLTLDEVSNIQGEQTSEMCFTYSHGRPRNRMQSQFNAERSNSLRWALIAVLSGNKSLQDQLYSLKDFPEGELMRILEFHVPRADDLTKEETDELFMPMFENYGVAGEIFMRYVIANLDEVNNLRKSIQKKLDRACGFMQRERYWSAMCACAMTAGIIGKKLNLFNIDPQAVYAWLVETLSTMRMDISPTKDTATSKVGQFINQYINNILVVNNTVDKRVGIMQAPVREPRGELLIRYEPDTQKMFIVVKNFREWCGEHQISYKMIKKELVNQNVVVDEVKKCMARGYDVNTPAVWALVFDCTKIEEFNTDGLFVGDDL